MRTGALVLALTMAGAVGGAVGALVAVSGDSSPGPAAAPPPTPGKADAPPGGGREVADLRNRIEILEANLGNSVAETARLREELATATKVSGEARDRVAALEARPAPAPDAGHLLAGGRKLEIGNALRIEGGTFAAPGIGERFRKMAELRALPVEDRWARARDALGLTTTQEEELKAALKERNEGLEEVAKAAFQAAEEARRAGGEQPATGRLVDPAKTEEVRRRYDDRVGQTLNADQQKKWKEEGFEGALGGGPQVVATYRAEVLSGEAK